MYQLKSRLFAQGVLVGSILALSGCATPAMNFDLKSVERSKRPLDAEIKIVTVAVESAKNVDGTFQSIIVSTWRAAVEKGLADGRFFSDDSRRKIDLKVTAKALNYSIFHGELDLTATYDFVDRTNDKVIFSTTIQNKGTDATFVGSQRSANLSNKVISENIRQFFEKLQTSQPALGQALK